MDIFLDLGYTLLGSSLPSPAKAIAKKLEVSDKEVDVVRRVVFTRNCKDPFDLIEELEQALNRSIDRSGQRFVVDMWKQTYDKTFALLGANDFLDALFYDDFRVHIVSNLWYPFHEAFKMLFPGVENRVASETLSYEIGFMKPHPKFYEVSITRSGINPVNAVSIGDSMDTDIVPWLELGATCIHYISRGFDKTKVKATSLVVQNAVSQSKLFTVSNYSRIYYLLSNMK